MPKPVIAPSYCTAKSKRTGERCKHHARPGTNVCSMHGGKAPHVMQAAARRVEEARVWAAAQRFLAKQEFPPVDDPLQALLDLAAEATAYREVFRVHVDDLLAQGAIRYDHRAGEQLRAEVALWERSAERCLKIYSEIARLGIAERVTRIRAAELMVMAEGIREIMRRMDLTPEQRKLAVKVVPEVLRELEAPKETPKTRVGP